jgi:subfamily B ATP-binding cassette protein MsbA
MTSQEQHYDGTDVLRRLYRYLGAYKYLLVVAVISMIIMAITEAGFSALMKPLTDISFVEQNDSSKQDILFWAPLILVAIFLVRGVTAIITKYSLDIVTRNIIQKLRAQMFDKVLMLPTSYFDHISSGQLVSKFIYDVEQVANAANNTAMILVKDSLSIIALLGWMLYMNWQLTTALLVVIPILAIILRMVTKRFRTLSQRIQNSMGNVTNISEEVISGHRVVRIYGGERYEKEYFETENAYNRAQQLKLSLTTALNVNLLQMIVGFCFAAIIGLAISQGVTAGTFVSFMFAMMMLLPAIRNFSNLNATLQKGITAANSVFSLLDEEEEIDHGEKVINRTEGAIDYNINSFSYDESKGEVLRDIHLQIKPGESVAFVGRSGSGKSTLVNLLPRFYEIDDGSISIDGININDLKIESLRQQIAIVSQEVVLFNDTIERNIAYGQLSECSHEQVREAARAAHALEFIENLPEEFNTVVGESGTLLSGGQRQRLAIARALLKDAPILILDEATSALDTQSERHIQEALETLMQNRTTLVIAHRLSTIENVDRIIVMDNGQIVEIGTHQELLDKNGYYADLYRMQFNT